MNPSDLKYSKDHEWARMEGDTAKIGITDYAQDQLGDIVYVELPSIGDAFNIGDEFGTVESVKAVSELYMPIGGEIMAVNTSLEDDQDRVNTQPYGDGWMVEVKPTDTSDYEALMTKEEYLNHINGEK